MQFTKPFDGWHSALECPVDGRVVAPVRRVPRSLVDRTWSGASNSKNYVVAFQKSADSFGVCQFEHTDAKQGDPRFKSVLLARDVLNIGIDVLWEYKHIKHVMLLHRSPLCIQSPCGAF